MKETNSVFFLVIFELICFMSCKTATILDFETNEAIKFFQTYSFEDTYFSEYRYGDFLMLAHIIRPDYESYKLYLAVYSKDEKKIDFVVDEVEVLNTRNEVLIVSDSIKQCAMPEQTKNNLYVTYINLLDKIQLTKENYIVKVYLKDKIYTYQFYPEEKKFLIMR